MYHQIVTRHQGRTERRKAHAYPLRNSAAKVTSKITIYLAGRDEHDMTDRKPETSERVSETMWAAEGGRREGRGRTSSEIKEGENGRWV